MSRRYSAEWLNEITGVSDRWLRRCEDKPERGLPINRYGLRVVLGQSDSIIAEPNGTITWHANGRKFTATPAPVPDHGMEAGAGAPA